MHQDDGQRQARPGRPQNPLPPGLTQAERAFLDHMRAVTSRAGSTLGSVSRGLADLVENGSSSGTAASASELSRMLSGKRTFRPAVITGLHTLAARSGGADTAALDEDIAAARALFHGWLEVRDPALWRYYQLEQVLVERSRSLQDAERLAHELAARLEDARSFYTVAVGRLTELTEGAYGDLAQHKEEIIQLASRIRRDAQEIPALQEALENAWRAVGFHAGEFAAAGVELAELATEQLFRQAGHELEPATGALVEWLRSLQKP